jgi:predicted Fe-Mo cluster-binding NifX family protein
MLFAVASKDGVHIDQHFGHAERFLIYRVTEDGVELVEEKRVEPYCSHDPDHPLRKPLLDAIAEALKGCGAVVCAQIGQAPLLEMERLGLDVYTMAGPIVPSLIELSKVV